MMNEENDLVLEERWGVGSRTLLNWREKGVEVGDLPPLGPDDGESFLDWYRAHYGREPSKKVKSSPGVTAAREVAAPVDELDLDLVEVEVLKGVLGRLGLSLNLSRVIEEVEGLIRFMLNCDLRGKIWTLLFGVGKMVWKSKGNCKRETMRFRPRWSC
tara:strand:+ start:627 stop:1100 length:474 start_codon:yes stop_codon:yes gene_type:complete